MANKKKVKKPKSSKKTSPSSSSPSLELTSEKSAYPFIVAIGASAGGLETLKTFFQHSKPDADMAFIVITHLSHDHVSMLPEILQQYTTMNTLSIENQTLPQSGTVYVLPP